VALCNPKTLRGIFGTARKLDLDIDELRAMTTTGRLSRIKEREAAGLLSKLRSQLPEARGKPPRRIWRLYTASTLYKEIMHYKALIAWRTPDGFTRFLKKYFGVEALEWVDSKQKAVDIKNALRRMANAENNVGARRAVPVVWD